MIWLAVELLVCWLVLANLVLLALYRRKLRLLWLEPTFKQPVILFESDDWGPGPVQHAKALDQIQQVLAQARDHRGRCAHMTIGTVLSIPDADKIIQSQYQTYTGIDLSAPQFSAVLTSLKNGWQKGLFSLQLHGREHFWPTTLLAAIRDSDELKQWLANDSSATEQLPSTLQSRWNPPISVADIALAVKQETELFKRCFGFGAEVAVPPTFIWHEQVEISWRSQGINTIICPGKRFVERQQSQFRCDQDLIVNLQTSQTGQTYLVRDQYFEPEYGHQWQDAMVKIATCLQLGRPCLFETHRFNFTDSAQACHNSLQQLQQLLAHALKRWPDCCFLTNSEIINLPQHDPDHVLEHGWRARLKVWLARANTLPRFRYFATFTGLSFMGWLLTLTFTHPKPSLTQSAQP
ncbi:hypothetical protein [Motilimonas eburnea]|uniref:hypothetical protein n=1 Tax=Motilimonas eburnea TaxID=1737488 RepID=UPI001E37A40A|nr:hypothetical protein [Motilimonas eburnea]MCE2572210.1 hypothetical protein [Motilimonas eburnea]